VTEKDKMMGKRKRGNNWQEAHWRNDFH